MQILYFNKKQNRSIEVSDAVIDCGDSLVLIEDKGGYLSLNEKYSDDSNKLLRGIAEKFGLEKAIKQLSRSIGILFSEDREKRDTFAELDGRRRPVNIFTAGDLSRVRKVYPVLVVQDFSMTTGFINRRLRIQFAGKLEEYEISTDVHVRPLSVLTVEDLENVLEHLEEIRFTDFLDEYASEKHQPLSTFDSVLNKFLKSRGSDEKRRYRWSVTRGEEFFKSIMKKFIIEE